MVNLFNPFEPHITALHITDNLDFEERVKKEGFDTIIEQTGYPNLDIKILHNRSDADTSEIIDSYASLIEANLIVVLKKNKSFFEKVFRTSTTTKLLNQSHVPVMVFHEK
ncbi:MAG: universal stress protein [Bacteroidales bacterium]|nr:universal stress protein [Bacteroidales bacterium]